MDDTYPCPHCQQELGRTASLPPGSKVRCPRCENVLSVPPLKAAECTHAVEGQLCPNCKNVLADDAVLCLRCGFHLPTGERLPAERKRRKARRRSQIWDGDLAMTPRIAIAGVCTALSLGLGITLIMLDQVGGGIAAFFLGAAFSALGMGTFICVELTYDQRNRPFIELTQRLCFIPVRREKVNPRKFAKIVIEHTGDSSGMQTLLVVGLFVCCGIFPGLLYLFVFSGRYLVYLAVLEGLDHVVLFRGWSEKCMRDLTDTLIEVTGLPLG